MKTRKRIGVIIVNPEQVYQHRIMDGIITQCKRYDYDIVAFSPLVDIWFMDKIYLNAEMNLIKLINFDLIDALLVVTISLTRNDDYSEVRKLAKYLKENCPKPVSSVDIPIGDNPCAVTDDAPAFRRIISHVLDVHGVKPEELYILTGRQGLQIAENRIKGCMEELRARGLDTSAVKVFYGDFWFPGGAELAERIISGELPVPRAVICGNDFMAIALTNRLISAGIKVPEQVIVTGYDATQDAVVNETPITSFIPNIGGSAQAAVNILHRRLEPDAPEIPPDEVNDNALCIGGSCGCSTNINYIRHNFQQALYKTSHDYTKGYTSDTGDMATIIESYMLEKLTSSKTPEECLEEISRHTYLLAPYRNFYLILRPDWLDTYNSLKEGYPPTVRAVVHTIPAGSVSEDRLTYHKDDPHRDFPTSMLLPQLTNPRENPSVFYFAPVHFQEDTLGYCVLQCDLDQNVKLSAVFRNWVRNINNALEMTRVQNRLISFSLYDSMTGLYNRRGMDRAFNNLCRSATERDSCFVCVIDMNWLKRINDDYGHPEGDFALLRLARCASDIVTDERFCAIRAGGDEFFVIGIGQFSENMGEQKKQRLLEAIDRTNRTSGRPYKISAGIGYCLKKYTPGIKLEELIHEADQNMYEHKKLIKESET